MNLDEAQRAKIAEWIGMGMKLSEIQDRMGKELGLRLTYMEVRMVVDDLKLTPKDADIPKAAPKDLAAPGKTEPAAEAPGLTGPAGKGGGVSVKVDQITRAGALVSGQVTFSDGKTAEWYMDQTGRLGLVPREAGYRPPASDVQQFQMALEQELSKLGM
jgi:hypothetical protein